MIMPQECAECEYLNNLTTEECSEHCKDCAEAGRFINGKTNNK
jgi:hypothetical protein